MLKESETVMIYRVEHRRTGEGPYRPDFYDDLSDMHDDHDASERHPAPRFDDMDPWAYMDMLFAFKDMEQLDAWFDPHFKEKMHGLGFIIREYEVPIHFVEIGGHQVAFDQEVSDLRGEKSLVEPLVS